MAVIKTIMMWLSFATVLPGAGAEAFKASNWRLRTDQFLEIFKSRVSKNSIVVGLIPSEIEKEKLRRAEDLIEKKVIRIGVNRLDIAAHSLLLLIRVHTFISCECMRQDNVLGCMRINI
jgi:hypothetical protein